MKVLITAPSLDEKENVSGISTLVREIIRNGKSQFYHFTAGRRDDEKAGVVWILKQILLPLRFFWQIFRKKIDLVHINTAFVPLSIVRDTALIAAARLAGRPVLLHPNGGRFLIENFDSRFLAWIAEKMARMSSKVLVLSELEKESLTRRWQGLNISILPNAIATDSIPSVERKNKEKTIIFFGRIHESKGLHEIIEACEILKKEGFRFQFKCFGTGPLKDFFISEMSRVLGEKFYYGGVVSGREKWQALAESDIFLLPSRYGEGLPLAMLEAMAAKCVVVVADVASVQAVIKDGENGFVVEPYNTRQTVEKLKILLSDKADWENLRRNALATIKENYSIEDYVEKLEIIYQEIAALK
ncbi:MAG TPA: glycosyltransferase family 4 protein [Pyrinomonadaceae bacterium]|nr:glycosyltransferase family 4 protein [Pyrinomonadaceae bacterium]